MSANEIVKEKLKTLPTCPGVYLMKDILGTVIYVGKAKILKNRVSSYFISTSSKDIKTRTMVSKIADIDYIITKTEAQALVLECNLIKENQPFYNILLKDDKTYPYIMIKNELYPTVTLTRNIKDRTNKYYGPFPNAYDAKRVTEAINKIYPTKKCTKTLEIGKRKGTRCIQYHIGACPGYCDGKDRTEEYKELVKNIQSILSANTKDFITLLEKEMLSSSEEQNYERAADFKLYIENTQNLYKKNLLESSGENEGDYISFYTEKNIAYAFILNMRMGKVVDKSTLEIKNANDEEKGALLYAVITQYYNNRNQIPKNIYIPFEAPEMKEAELFLSSICQRKVNILCPKIGNHKKLIDLATENAQNTCQMKKTKAQQQKEREEKALAEIENFLGKEGIFRMESYDISHISGTLTAGGMVVYDGVKKDKKAYRKFRIQSVEGANDLSSISEVLVRRFSEAKKEMDEETPSPRFLPLPDLILIDGGAPHAKLAKAIVDSMGFDIGVCAMVKNNHHRLRGLVLPNKTEKKLDDFQYAKKLLFEMNEEVHRFSLSYHTEMRRKKAFSSSLTKIMGVGETTAKLLLKEFGSVEKIKSASLKELENIKGLNKATAKNIYEYFHL